MLLYKQAVEVAQCSVHFGTRPPVALVLSRAIEKVLQVLIHQVASYPFAAGGGGV